MRLRGNCTSQHCQRTYADLKGFHCFLVG